MENPGVIPDVCQGPIIKGKRRFLADYHALFPGVPLDGNGCGYNCLVVMAKRVGIEIESAYRLKMELADDAHLEEFKEPYARIEIDIIKQFVLRYGVSLDVLFIAGSDPKVISALEIGDGQHIGAMVLWHEKDHYFELLPE